MSVPGDAMIPAGSVTGYTTTNPPKSPRAQNFTDMVFQPGIASNDVTRQLKGRWVGSNRVRWHKGLPEKIGGWEPIPLTNSAGSPASYAGTVRATIDWASLDGQYWIAYATESKLYIVNNGVLYDITPARKVSNLNNAFLTNIGFSELYIVDPDNFASVGDHISISGPITFNGIVLNGDYQIIAILNSTTYLVRTAMPATSSNFTPAGGPATITYDIGSGYAMNTVAPGYGTGQYGEGTYGQGQPGQGILTKMRIWSLANWGQDLVASYTNGEIYWWQWTYGPNVRAQIIPNAPTSVQRIIVDANEQVLIAVGASTLAGAADAMNIRWASIGNLQDWIPVVLPTANTAGGQRLNFGSRMVAAINSRQQMLLWSDTQLYQMQFNGQTSLYSMNALGKCLLVGPNAAIDVNGVVYMWCFDDFYIYDGTLRVLECDMWETVFGTAGQGIQTGAGSPLVIDTGLEITIDSGQTLTTDTGGNSGFDRSQAEMVYAASYSTKNEVTWFFPSEVGDVMQYITYNYDANCWYGGTMPRTAYRDVTPAVANYVKYPYGFNNGTLYQHEVGYDEHEPGGITNPMYYFLQSWDVGQQSDRPLLINSVIPDFSRLRNGCQFSYLTKEHPRDAAYQQIGPFIITPDCTKYDQRAGGSQIALLIEAASVGGQIVLGQDFRMGTWQSQAGPHGKRIGMGSQGSPINTNNP